MIQWIAKKKMLIILVAVIVVVGASGVTYLILKEENTPAKIVLDYEKAYQNRDKEKMKELATDEEYESVVGSYYPHQKTNNPIHTPYTFTEYKKSDSEFYYLYEDKASQHRYKVFQVDGKWRITEIGRVTFKDSTIHLEAKDRMEVYLNGYQK